MGEHTFMQNKINITHMPAIRGLDMRGFRGEEDIPVIGGCA